MAEWLDFLAGSLWMDGRDGTGRMDGWMDGSVLYSWLAWPSLSWLAIVALKKQHNVRTGIARDLCT